jgi:FlaA1/EpsC-like NDP-sugar epimerase
MIGSFMAATIIVSHDMETISLKQFLNMPIRVVNFLLFVVFSLLWHSIFIFFDLYSSRSLASVKNEIEDILFATSMGTFFIYALSLLFSIEIVTIGFIAMFWSVSICITFLARLIMHYSLKWARRRRRNLRYILIVGINSRAVEFARKIESEPDLGYVISGFVDEEWEGNGKLEKFGWKLVSDFKGFIEFIRNNVVDEVLVSLPVKSYYQEIASMMNTCENQGIVVRQIPNIFNTIFSKLKLEDIENETAVYHYRGSMEG